MDLVAHCGNHLDGRFLSTLTLTDLATGWTECIPLLEKSANAVLAALKQARTLFPFPLLGIDTDSGSEFLNAELIAYCEQEQLTFTRGRPGVKNDQAHIEQKNGAVVREAVGYVQLVGMQAYHQLREVYRALRLVVNSFQPSLKLQAKISKGEQVRRVYDVAQTPLQRLLASGALSEERQRDLSEKVQQIDPLALSAYLDALRHALLCRAHLPPAVEASGRAWPLLRFCLAACTSGARTPSEEGAERTDPQGIPSRAEEIPEEPWSPERIQGDSSESLPTEPLLLEEAVSSADQDPAPAPETPNSTIGKHESRPPDPVPLEQAIAAYMQEKRATGRKSKTLQWHQTSLFALQRYLWKRFHLTDVNHLSRACLQTWMTDLPITLSVRTGAKPTVSTVAAYARSVRAFCNWLVRQGYVAETLFPQGVVPHTQCRVPHPVEPEVFVRLLRACQLAGPPGGQKAAMTMRNHAILWLLLETGLSSSELCCLRLGDVDRVSGTVIVLGKRGRPRIFPLSADGQRAVCAYLDQARLTSAWAPAVPEAQDRLLLTERGYPLTKNSLTLLFTRLSQRAGFTRTPICPSMLRDTYAIRFLQAGGELAALQEQLGVAGLVSVKRYQHYCEQRSQEQGSRHVQRNQGLRGTPGEERAHARRNENGGEITDAPGEKRAVCGKSLAMEQRGSGCFLPQPDIV
jgi:site-specific recombinase XerD